MTLVAAETLAGSAQAPVRGRVVADDSGDPLRNAIVTLEADANVGPVLTDAEGRFTIEGAPRGLHTVSVSKTGYAAADLRLPDGVEIRLLRGSAISGRVLDDFGEPSMLRTVVAERLVHVEGRVDFTQQATVETDDTGAYRLVGLPPGEFVLAVAGGRLKLG